MGHDIFAIIDNAESNDEIAYLRRNAGNQTIHIFYQLLDCTDCDGGVSGNGQRRIIDKEKLIEVKKGLKEMRWEEDEIDDYMNFVNKCIQYCVNNVRKELTIVFA